MAHNKINLPEKICVSAIDLLPGGRNGKEIGTM